KGSDSGSSGQKYARSFIFYRTEYIVKKDFTSSIQFSQLISYSFSVFIDLDDKFEMWPVIERGESEGPDFFFPSGYIDRDVRRMSGRVMKVFWFFYYKSLYIMGQVICADNL